MTRAPQAKANGHIGLLLVSLTAAVCAAPRARAETNFLANPAFNLPCSTVKGFHCIGLLGKGTANSDARYWEIYNTTEGGTDTTQEPSTLVTGGTMLEVVTTTGGNGIAQTIQPASGSTVLCVWLKINRGAVSIAAGSGLNAPPAATLLNQGTWEVLNLSASANPVTAVTISSYGGAADFYVESARLSLTHSQCVPR